MIARRSVSLALVWLCAAAGALVWCSAPALGQREHVFSAAGSPIERFGSGHLSGGGGVAVNASSGTVYVANSTADTVAAFAELVLPSVSTGRGRPGKPKRLPRLPGASTPKACRSPAASSNTGPAMHTAALAPCTANPGAGTAPVAVSATLTGLHPGLSYHYRLVAGNASGSNSGEDRTFAHGA